MQNAKQFLTWFQQYIGIPHSIILCFTNWKSVTTASSKSIGVVFSTASAHFLSLFRISVILPVFHYFFITFYLLWWSIVSDYNLGESSVDRQHFFSNKAFFKWRYIHCLVDIMLLPHLIYYSINVNKTFICTGKLTNSFDLLYWDICFIAVFWNQACYIS